MRRGREAAVEWGEEALVEGSGGRGGSTNGNL
jgi:hypothetical protein